jgi:hypothetical protein
MGVHWVNWRTRTMHLAPVQGGLLGASGGGTGASCTDTGCFGIGTAACDAWDTPDAVRRAATAIR